MESRLHTPPRVIRTSHVRAARGRTGAAPPPPPACGSAAADAAPPPVRRASSDWREQGKRRGESTASTRRSPSLLQTAPRKSIQEEQPQAPAPSSSYVSVARANPAHARLRRRTGSTTSSNGETANQAPSPRQRERKDASPSLSRAVETRKKRPLAVPTEQPQDDDPYLRYDVSSDIPPTAVAAVGMRHTSGRHGTALEVAAATSPGSPSPTTTMSVPSSPAPPAFPDQEENEEEHHYHDQGHPPRTCPQTPPATVMQPPQVSPARSQQRARVPKTPLGMPSYEPADESGLSASQRIRLSLSGYSTIARIKDGDARATAESNGARPAVVDSNGSRVGRSVWNGGAGPGSDRSCAAPVCSGGAGGRADAGRLRRATGSAFVATMLESSPASIAAMIKYIRELQQSAADLRLQLESTRKLRHEELCQSKLRVSHLETSIAQVESERSQEREQLEEQRRMIDELAAQVAQLQARTSSEQGMGWPAGSDSHHSEQEGRKGMPQLATVSEYQQFPIEEDGNPMSKQHDGPDATPEWNGCVTEDFTSLQQSSPSYASTAETDYTRRYDEYQESLKAPAPTSETYNESIAETPWKHDGYADKASRNGSNLNTDSVYAELSSHVGVMAVPATHNCELPDRETEADPCDATYQQSSYPSLDIPTYEPAQSVSPESSPTSLWDPLAASGVHSPRGPCPPAFMVTPSESDMIAPLSTSSSASFSVDSHDLNSVTPCMLSNETTESIVAESHDLKPMIPYMVSNGGATKNQGSPSVYEGTQTRTSPVPSSGSTSHMMTLPEENISSDGQASPAPLADKQVDTDHLQHPAPLAFQAFHKIDAKTHKGSQEKVSQSSSVSLSLEKHLEVFFTAVDRSKLRMAAVYAKRYKGHEEKLFAELSKRYGDSEVSNLRSAYEGTPSTFLTGEGEPVGAAFSSRSSGSNAPTLIEASCEASSPTQRTNTTTGSGDVSSITPLRESTMPFDFSSFTDNGHHTQVDAISQRKPGLPSKKVSPTKHGVNGITNFRPHDKQGSPSSQSSLATRNHSPLSRPALSPAMSADNSQPTHDLRAPPMCPPPTEPSSWLDNPSTTSYDSQLNGLRHRSPNWKRNQSRASPSTTLVAMDATTPTTVSLENLLTEFYRKHQPDKLRNVSAVVKEYMGKEQELIDLLRKKYGALSVKHLEENLAALQKLSANRGRTLKRPRGCIVVCMSITLRLVVTGVCVAAICGIGLFGLIQVGCDGVDYTGIKPGECQRFDTDVKDFDVQRLNEVVLQIHPNECFCAAWGAKRAQLLESPSFSNARDVLRLAPFSRMVVEPVARHYVDAYVGDVAWSEHYQRYAEPLVDSSKAYGIVGQTYLTEQYEKLLLLVTDFPSLPSSLLNRIDSNNVDDETVVTINEETTLTKVAMASKLLAMKLDVYDRRADGISAPISTANELSYPQEATTFEKTADGENDDFQGEQAEEVIEQKDHHDSFYQEIVDAKARDSGIRAVGSLNSKSVVDPADQSSSKLEVQIEFVDESVPDEPVNVVAEEKTDVEDMADGFSIGELEVPEGVVEDSRQEITDSSVPDGVFVDYTAENIDDGGATDVLADIELHTNEVFDERSVSTGSTTPSDAAEATIGSIPLPANSAKDIADAISGSGVVDLLLHLPEVTNENAAIGLTAVDIDRLAVNEDDVTVISMDAAISHDNTPDRIVEYVVSQENGGTVMAVDRGVEHHENGEEMPLLTYDSATNTILEPADKTNGINSAGRSDTGIGELEMTQPIGNAANVDNVAATGMVDDIANDAAAQDNTRPADSNDIIGNGDENTDDDDVEIAPHEVGSTLDDVETAVDISDAGDFKDTHHLVDLIVIGEESAVDVADDGIALDAQDTFETSTADQLGVREEVHVHANPAAMGGEERSGRQIQISEEVVIDTENDDVEEIRTVSSVQIHEFSNDQESVSAFEGEEPSFAVEDLVIEASNIDDVVVQTAGHEEDKPSLDELSTVVDHTVIVSHAVGLEEEDTPLEDSTIAMDHSGVAVEHDSSSTDIAAPDFDVELVNSQPLNGGDIPVIDDVVAVTANSADEVASVVSDEKDSTFDLWESDDDFDFDDLELDDPSGMDPMELLDLAELAAAELHSLPEENTT